MTREHSESTDLLLARLGSLQRRATLVLFSQALCVSGCVSLLLSEALFIGGVARSASVAMELAAAVAVLPALVMTLVLRPTLRDIAAAIDARLHLQDRLITALAFRATDDPFSRLVVRDAQLRLAGVPAHDAVPVVLPRGIRLTLIAAASISAGMIVATTAVPSWAPTRWSGFGGPRARASAAGMAPSAGRKAISQQTSPSATLLAAAQNETPSSTSQQSVSNSPASTRQSLEVSSDGASSATLGTDRGETGPAASAATTSSKTDAQTDAPDGRGATAGGMATSRQAGNGGVANGMVAPGTTTPTAAPNADPAYGAAYRSGRAAAESAIAQERVPVDRRSYVRDYFMAIRPAGDK